MLRIDFCSVLRIIIENMRKNTEIKEIIHLLETILINDQVFERACILFVKETMIKFLNECDSA